MITYFDRQFFGYHQWKALTVGYVCVKEEGYSPTFVKTVAFETWKDAKKANASNAGNARKQNKHSQIKILLYL